MDISGVSNSATTAPAAAAPAPAENRAQNRDVIQAVKALNAAGMFGQENELLFQKDPQTQRMVVRMVDRQTKQVISQIPPEYVLQLSADIKTPAAGQSPGNRR